MKIRHFLLFTLLGSTLVLSATVLGSCQHLGVFATAEDQKSWPPPCGIRGPQYELACIDDPVNPNAVAACPCHPALRMDGGSK